MEVKPRPVRVLVVDDHPAVRNALGNAFRRSPLFECCGEADSGAAALEMIEASHPDVAIIDISLSDAHGLDLIRDIRSRYPDVRMVVYSMFAEDTFAERAIRAGAIGYVDKSNPTTEVLDAAASAANGNVYVTRRTASRILRRLVKSDQAGKVEEMDQLSDREMVVFQMLGQGLLVEDIADRLNLTRKTVEAYRRAAKKKLGFDTVTELMLHGHEWLSKHT